MTDTVRNAPAQATLACVIAVLVAACGGGSVTSGTSKKYQEALAFVQCMRAHGEPSFPDPASNGTVTDSQAQLGSPQLHEAISACHGLLPGGALQVSAAQQQALIQRALRQAECLRAHGITNFPDPSLRNGSLSLSLKGTRVDPASPAFLAAARACGLPLRIGRPGQPGGGS